jgi:hypothetical protein
MLMLIVAGVRSRWRSLLFPTASQAKSGQAKSGQADSGQADQ